MEREFWAERHPEISASMMTKTGDGLCWYRWYWQHWDIVMADTGDTGDCTGDGWHCDTDDGLYWWWFILMIASIGGTVDCWCRRCWRWLFLVSKSWCVARKTTTARAIIQYEAKQKKFVFFACPNWMKEAGRGRCRTKPEVWLWIHINVFGCISGKTALLLTMEAVEILITIVLPWRHKMSVTSTSVAVFARSEVRRLPADASNLLPLVPFLPIKWRMRVAVPWFLEGLSSPAAFNKAPWKLLAQNTVSQFSLPSTYKATMTSQTIGQP